MAHDVFISYSNENKTIADALCHYLEERKIRCWIAPRDIASGSSYAAEIAEAIESSRVCVIVFSEHSATSKFCKREVCLAVESNKIVIPFRIDAYPLEKDMKFFLSGCHWVDALPDPEAFFSSTAKAIARQLSIPLAEEQSSPVISSSCPSKKTKAHIIFRYIRLYLTSILTWTLPFFPLELLKKNFEKNTLIGFGITLPICIICTYFFRYDNLQGLREIWQMICRFKLKEMIWGYLRIWCSSLIIFFAGVFLFWPFLIPLAAWGNNMSAKEFILFFALTGCFFYPSLAVWKVGEAILMEDYQKFHFSKERFNKWITRIVLSFAVMTFVLLIGGACGIFNKKTQENTQVQSSEQQK